MLEIVTIPSSLVGFPCPLDPVRRLATSAAWRDALRTERP